MERGRLQYCAHEAIMQVRRLLKRPAAEHECGRVGTELARRKMDSFHGVGQPVAPGNIAPAIDRVPEFCLKKILGNHRPAHITGKPARLSPDGACCGVRLTNGWRAQGWTCAGRISSIRREDFRILHIEAACARDPAAITTGILDIPLPVRCTMEHVKTWSFNPPRPVHLFLREK
jgi:hypothetical protein